ncbi:MAG TPA: hypothetical protein VMV14_09920 [Acidimicrobiales bacterium]|nr:hypothetical protein [Acidimicrobiales bacterium]
MTRAEAPHEANAGGTCQSCGAPSEELVSVHRVYLETDGRGTVTGSTTVADAEWWCLACRILYPHEPDPHDPSA